MSWTVPAGKSGDTTTVAVSTAPTSYYPVTYSLTYKWVDDYTPQPVDSSEPLPPDSLGPPPTTGPDLVSNWQVPPDNTGAEALGAQPDPVIVRNGADGGVTAGATSPSTFDLDGPYLVTQIMTYHYGSRARPGTIGLRNDDGTEYGPWPAAGAGSAAIPNAYWWARPNIVIPAGHYTVLDSDPPSWSREAATDGAGIFQIWGSPQ